MFDLVFNNLFFFGFVIKQIGILRPHKKRCTYIEKSLATEQVEFIEQIQFRRF